MSDPYSSKGFFNSTPNWLKSLTFLVTTVSRWTVAVAAIMASSLIVSDLLCMRRAHSRKVGASIAKTPKETRTLSSQDSSSSAFGSSCSRVISIPACNLSNSNARYEELLGRYADDPV